MFALEAEIRLPLERGEGPIGMILCPSVSTCTTLVFHLVCSLVFFL